MSSLHSKHSENPFTRWILDRDGNWWGDEHERLRRYEAIAVIEHAQLVLVPGAIAVMAWTCPRATAKWLAIALAAFMIPGIVGFGFTIRYKLGLPSWTRRQIQWVLMSATPYLAAVLGLWSKMAKRSTSNGGFVAGVCFGVFGLFAAIAFSKRKQAKRNAQLEDLD